VQQRRAQRTQIRLAEVIAALSLATDLGAGVPLEHALRSCLLAVDLAAELGVSGDELGDVYYVALLAYAGCSADMQTIATVLGDEIAMGKYIAAIDYDRPAEMFGALLRHVGEGHPPLRRAGILAASLTAGVRMGKDGGRAHSAAHCEVAQLLADRLGFGPTVRHALGQDVDSVHQVGGAEAAIAVARQRAGGAYDPAIVERFCQRAPTLLAHLETESAWEAALDAEPGTQRSLSEEQLDAAVGVMADFTDLKSPYTVGHSSGVAALAEAAARRCHCPEADVVAVRRAACVHDLGRVGVTVAIWDKAGPLRSGEWEQVRLHPYYTERVLARSSALSPLGALATLHHERLDGSGYHRGLPAAMLPLPARILAAADAYHAMTEPRPHRPALTPEAAAEEARGEVRAGRLDGEAVSAVLAVAGHRVRSAQREWAAGLSEREVEVLRLVARGLSNRQMAQTLVIAEKIVGHHIQHIYDKIGVSTRAAATLFAMQHDPL
jgi:HD-GYP domain-containing protein (c-di-GMP phosphodiesterase class II)